MLTGCIMIDYGTNNEKAFTDLCETGERHDWKHEKLLGNCYNLYVCRDCSATMRIDSSD